MQPFKLPAHKRKAKGNKAPPRIDFNDYAVGFNKARKFVASVERAGHQTMVVHLKAILRNCSMTAQQAREVQAELAWRQSQVKRLKGIIENCQRNIRDQYAKPGAASHTNEEVPLVPGPHGLAPASKLVRMRRSQQQPEPDGLYIRPKGGRPRKVTLEVHATPWAPQSHSSEPPHLSAKQ
jgi:hypothetical protein